MMRLPLSVHLAVASVAAALALAGCAAVKVRVPASRVPAASGTAFLAGAARVDITPPPGYPMGGYSWIGRVARGHWLPLHARALFFEDAHGHRLALVSSDLWSLPRGLHARVTELLAGDPVLRTRMGERRIDRDEIVLAATHTHQSPGAYSTDSMFSTFGAPKVGFDRALFEFLAQRIAGAIADAAIAARPAALRYGVARADGLLRNRSFAAFERNTDARDTIAHNQDLVLCDEEGYAPEACRAVDPTLRVLRVVDAVEGRSIAAAAFFAAHPTVVHHDLPLYSSDVFGALALGVEHKLRDREGGDPVVAVFNGAEGDVSFRWRSQDRGELVRLSDMLSKEVLDTLGAAHTVETGAISSYYDVFSLVHRRVRSRDGRRVRTARVPMAGRATVVGAEDGRNDVPRWLSHEGKRGLDCGAHGRKIGAFDLAEIGGLVIPPLWMTRLMAVFVRPERDAAISVHRLGPLVLATLPGEFTTTLGRRIHASVARASGAAPDDVALIGLAQSYAYYFAAPEEYDAQHYEGSGTLFGRHAGELVGMRLTRLAAAGPDTMPVRTGEHGESYSAGLARSFGPRSLDVSPEERRDDFTRALGDGTVSRWCWAEPPRPLADFAMTAVRAVPSVTIETNARGAWAPWTRPGREGRESLDVVTVAGKPRDATTCWCAYWLTPDGAEAQGTYRFAVTRSGASRSCEREADCSAPFSPAAGLLYATCP